MRNAGGYSLQYNGRNIQITVLDTVEDYDKLANVLVFDGTYVYYIKEKRVFVLKNIVIASGDFHYISEEYDGLTLDEWITKQEEAVRVGKEMLYDKIDMNNRRKYTYEASQSSASEEEEKYSTEEETPEWFIESIEKIKSMEFKTADTNETVMELKVPTFEELDDYFSFIGYSGCIYDK